MALFEHSLLLKLEKTPKNILILLLICIFPIYERVRGPTSTFRGTYAASWPGAWDLWAKLTHCWLSRCPPIVSAKLNVVIRPDREKWYCKQPLGGLKKIQNKLYTLSNYIEIKLVFQCKVKKASKFICTSKSVSENHVI